MFANAVIEENVAVSPEEFSYDIHKSIENTINKKEGTFFSDKGAVLCSFIKTISVGNGKINARDANIYYHTTYNALIFKPWLNEVVSGEVVDCAVFGAFVRIGFVEALLHISQISDERFAFDEKNKAFISQESKKILKVGDIVRARIVSISSQSGQMKIGITMRQPFLGKLEWINIDKEFAKKNKAEKTEKFEKNEKKYEKK
ncbi:MAG: DNA-directed RNA polymerase [Candidatus Huberarchaeum crystalense]|uniref:DNA-directed RNA polymerase n=1 Tax=Huberarchaeum crystalense TaxID=2014257 RepID=A0A2G9LJP4_HUBC1|nr:MAG: DNA-directed RNA polymerase [Candidatus Huberarchaeum crystalense]